MYLILYSLNINSVVQYYVKRFTAPYTQMFYVHVIIFYHIVLRGLWYT